MSNAWAQFLTVMTGLLTVAIVALILSKRSQTPQVLSGFFGGFTQALNAAVSPVTGGQGFGIGSGLPSSLGI